MTTHIRPVARVAALILALVLSAVSLPLAISAVSVEDAVASTQMPPIAAMVEGQELIPVHGERGYALCLPGGTELSSVTVVYTGQEQMYLPDTDAYVAPGGTAVLDLSDGEGTVYEYDSAQKQFISYALRAMTGSKIPSIYVTLEDAPEAGNSSTLEWLHTNKELSVAAAMRMIDGDGKVVYDGKLDTFKGRGNTSFVAPGLATDEFSVGAYQKKSYNIKLAKKAELIDGTGKMKKWSLLHMRVSDAYFYDFTGLCSSLGFRTYAALAGERYFDIKSQYTDLYVNGEYRGVYILTERLDNKAAVSIADQEDFVVSESSAKITVRDADDPAIAAGVQYYKYTADAVAPEPFDLSGGYLLEVNFKNLEECGFVTAHNVYFDLKAPEACTREQVQYIARYVQEFENALYSPTGRNAEGKHYSEYADLDSLASMILTYAYFQNWELFRTSTYAYLDTADSEYPVLTFGPAWDFETGEEVLRTDLTLFGEHNVYAEEQQYAWLEQLWQKGDFMQIVYDKAVRLSDIMARTLGQKAADGIETASGLIDAAHDSLVMNWQRWSLESTLNGRPRFIGRDNSFDAHVKSYTDALVGRLLVWDGLWDSGDYLFGVDAVGYKEKSTGRYAFDCTATGSRIRYQWYRVNADGTVDEVEGAISHRLITETEGDYYCVVTGPSNAYASVANGNVFSKEFIDIASPIVSTAQATEVDTLPSDAHIPGEWEVLIPSTCTETGMRVKRCTACDAHEVLVSEVTPAEGHDDGAWTVLIPATEQKDGVDVLQCTKCQTELDRRATDRIYINHFIDVKDSDWFAQAVQFVVQNNLFNGTGENTFTPNGSMTRGMLVTVLSRLEHDSTSLYASTKFTDVEKGLWYSGAVAWAAKNGIVNGVTETTFCPNDPITREQIATILYRYAEYKKYDTQASEQLDAYEDSGLIGDYALTAMQWARANRIINGISETRLDPKGESTRAQVAQMMLGFCGTFN